MRSDGINLPRKPDDEYQEYLYHIPCLFYRRMADTFNLGYDAEDRLEQVQKNGATIATFTFDADEKRVKSVMGSETVLFVGAHFEIKNGNQITKYYMAGSTRIAMRKYTAPEPMTVEYMLSDHLGSTSLTTDANGAKVLELRYKAWGEIRATWTSSPSTTPAYKMPLYQYTGQAAYLDDPLTSGVTEGFGLMFYNARWYDPYITHFVQADTITPGGVQGLDRYAYNFNNPTKYTDPSGHFPFGPLNNVITLVLNMVTQAQEKTAVDEVSKNSSTSVDVLVKMFSSNKLAGNTPQARLVQDFVNTFRIR